MQQKKSKKRVSNQAMPENDELSSIKAHLRGSLLKRLEVLAEGLEKQQDLDMLKKQLDCVEGLLKVLRILQD